MNTPSHFLLQLSIRKYYKEKKNFNIPKSFVLGAIAPDIILYLLVFFYILLSTLILDNSISSTFQYMFDDLYFNHPLWILGYNLLHSPTLLLIYFLLIRYVFKKYLGKYYRILKWFIIGCAVHTAFDIPLHHNDGPRIFYPFSDYIFMSPVSYWDPRYYGSIVARIELLLDIILIVYLFYSPIKSKIIGKKS